MRMPIRILFAGVLLATSGEVSGEVLDAAPAGFTIKNTVVVTTPPDKAYRRMIDRVNQWWDPDHTWSGDASKLRMEDRVGGCFCERLPSGGEVRHMDVIRVEPGRMLRMNGGLGPLQAMALTGVMTFTFVASDEGTQIGLTYTVGGYTKDGLEGLAPIVDAVQRGQLERLQRYLNTGTPVEP